MNAPEIKSDSKMWPAKLRIYEALYLFNRSVEDTLERLNELQRIGLDPQITHLVIRPTVSGT